MGPIRRRIFTRDPADTPLAVACDVALTTLGTLFYAAAAATLAAICYDAVPLDLLWRLLP
ncbi:hypothetical protein GCM10027202_17470 [Microvirgula curvata]